MRPKQLDYIRLIQGLAVATGIMIASQGAAAADIQTNQTSQTMATDGSTGIEISGRLSTGYLTGKTNDFNHERTMTLFGDDWDRRIRSGVVPQTVRCPRFRSHRYTGIKQKYNGNVITRIKG